MLLFVVVCCGCCCCCCSCCSALQCVAARCSALQCVAVCCSTSAQQSHRWCWQGLFPRRRPPPPPRSPCLSLARSLPLSLSARYWYQRYCGRVWVGARSRVRAPVMYTSNKFNETDEYVKCVRRDGRICAVCSKRRMNMWSVLKETEAFGKDTLARKDCGGSSSCACCFHVKYVERNRWACQKRWVCIVR